VPKLIFEKDFDQYQFQVWDTKPAFEICEVDQVHGHSVCDIHEASLNIKSDGLFANRKTDLTMAIRTADCVPIVVVGKKGAALLHAGWAGVKNQILLNPLVQKLEITKVFLGPHISVENYEVQDNFLQHFRDQSFFEIRNEKRYFNLALALQKQMPQLKFESSGICTFKNPHFHSFRRDKTTKRNYNILKIKGSL